MSKGAIVTILTIGAITSIATHLGLLQGFENAALDGGFAFAR